MAFRMEYDEEAEMLDTIAGWCEGCGASSIEFCECICVDCQQQIDECVCVTLPDYLRLPDGV